MNVKAFLQHVQFFYIEAAKQIKQRFPIDDKILKCLTILNPDTINSTAASSVISLATQFPNIIPESEVQQIDHEWRELQFMDPRELPSSSSEHRNDVVSFWGSLSQMTDTSGEYILLTKQSLPSNCVDFNPESSMYKLMNNRIYDSDTDSD